MDNIFNLIPILWRLKHMCSGHVTLILNFCNFLKNAPECIDPSGHFVFCESFCSSNTSITLFFPKVDELNTVNFSKNNKVFTL